MAHLHCRTDPVPYTTLDPGDMQITLHAHPMDLVMDVPETVRVAGEMLARVAQARAVKDAPAVEVDRG